MGKLLYSAEHASLTASGTDGPIELFGVSAGLLIVSVGGATGTTPSMTVDFEVADEFGNWVATSGDSGIGGSAITNSGVAAGNIGSGLELGLNGRISWTISGTTPNFTVVRFSLYGRQ